MTSNHSEPTLYLVGVPLDEEAPISAEAARVFASADVAIGENRKVAFRFLKQAPEKPGREVFLLDPDRDDEWERITEALRRLKQSGGDAVLFSDGGMPVLFDPGERVPALCRREGFRIRTVPGPTSWAVAAASSGWEPPFLLHGFLAREEKDREAALRTLARSPAHVVLLETPYRFKLLLRNLSSTLTRSHEVFLAWEIGKSTEWLWWGKVEGLESAAKARGLQKGEFILILKGSPSR